MRSARAACAAAVIVALCVVAPSAALRLSGASALPDALTDHEFWQLVTNLSEPGGWFRSDNLLSNELGFPLILSELARRVPAGGVYLGVGPEQNFNYIAALKPRMAFIVDVRRGNLDLHLMYKALFDLSSDRVEFVSRLFSRRRPAGLTSLAGVEQIFAAIANVETDEALYRENLKAITVDLLEAHRFPLAQEDLDGIAAIYGAFHTYGPSIRYSSSQGFGFGGVNGYNQPSYAELMTALDGTTRPRSYLATDESFQTLKALESKNLLVPVVGNFGGPKAVRAVGDYLKARGEVVSAFYLSNVEMYLAQQGIWEDFCRNVLELPLTEASIFIRSSRSGARLYRPGAGLDLSLGEMLPEVEECQTPFSIP